ncbi:TPA: hypothetical protein N2696_003538 [Vibrio parahaemolyticus]|uniref:hypothetical protein n=1 Tax=Vibrio parahaemolyticus TaxID=670 RepID=UPI0007A04107|nr:hypothetical protein [Vibrio parahaemolyticus]EGR1145859.1 hypothetical protein [Vibrio parahaemolyticus]EGR2359629.1 hypothetical protein [Vibrio parahaemolyticus]EGR3426286.1 hypothetical protein [Vibrio parahaemolyticus]ELB1650308.1 hypothetical protein [Vibrio parahaemolyticus]KYY41329.1 hypothetical protein AWQ17_20345 [Vibrio parahaemolyticus]
MKVNSSISFSGAAPLTGTESHTGNQGVVESVTNLEQALSLLESDSLNVADLKTLSDTVNNQRSALNLMSSRNAEADIANSLNGAIDQYAKELELIQGWTHGGKDMFNAANRVMFNTIVSSGNVSGIKLEDIFQIAIIDFMANNSNIPTDVFGAMQHFLESTGTGSHGVHEYWDGRAFSQNVDKVWDYMKSNASANSLSHEILNYLDTVGGKQVLKNQYSNAFDNSEGYAFNPGFDKNNGLSPMLRLTLMSNYLKENPDIKQADMEIFLKGSFGEIESFVQDTTQERLIDLLSKDSQWRIVDMNGKKVIDYFGVGLDSSFFVGLYQNFPPRVLSDEDTTNINRIGDTVKMIQQTLKYWIQIMRDERMAVARNI